MAAEKIPEVPIDREIVFSGFLKREVIVDLYFPPIQLAGIEPALLLINDGQDLEIMNFKSILENLYAANNLKPLICVGIHCGEDRRNEYGTAGILNYKGLGAKASLYTRFIFEELMPFIRSHFKIPSFTEKSFCGFSLGGLSALDIVWNHPKEFSKVGVFSGSLWWRTLSQDDPDFSEEEHRIIHKLIRNGDFYPWLKFFFETGTLDETADRNHNGIIDSIDDTMALINELIQKGYGPSSIHYLELKDGKHDVETWGRAFPEFLKWIFN